MQWIICGAQAIAKHFQSIVVARTTDKSLQGTPMQTDLTTFPDKQIKKVTTAMDKMDAKVSLDLALVKNKKDVIGSSWAEHDKLKITEEQLAAWHESIDQSYIVKANRTVLRMVHNVIFPNGRANTRVNQRLQHIVDTAGIRKIITDENTGDEGLWKADLWRTPAIQVWAKLVFKFEGCTDMINVEFVEDLSNLLQEVTTSGKTQIFYDVDAKLATLTLNIIQNFKDVPTFMNLFQASARQSMIKRHTTHGTDKDA